MAEKSSVFAFWQEKERKTGQDERTTSATRTSPLTRRLIKNMESEQSLDQKNYVNPKATSYKSLPGHNSLLSKSNSSVSDGNGPTEKVRSLHRNRPHSVMVLSKRFETHTNSSHVSPGNSPESRHKCKQISNTNIGKLLREEFRIPESAPPTIDNRDRNYNVPRLSIDGKLHHKEESVILNSTKSAPSTIDNRNQVLRLSRLQSDTSDTIKSAVVDNRTRVPKLQSDTSNLAVDRIPKLGINNEQHHKESDTLDTIKSAPSTINTRNHDARLGSNSKLQSDTSDGTKSAPPTIDNRKHGSFSWRSKETKQLLQTGGSFISYLDEITDYGDDGDMTNVVDQNQRRVSKMVRSSPVITKSPTIRHYSAQSIRRETMRAILRDRKFLKDPLIQEVETFWKIVKRIIEEKGKESTYLVSPTISRFTPIARADDGEERTQGRGVTTRQARSPGGGATAHQARSQGVGIITHQGSTATCSTNLSTVVTMTIEPGPVIKGVNSIETTCEVTCLVSEAIDKILSIIGKDHPLTFGQHNYQLKVCGKDEYLESDRCLLDYEYTHNCIKLNIPVNLVLVERSLVKQVMSRTATVVPEVPPIFARHALSLRELTSLVDSYFSKDEEFHNLLTKPPVHYTRMCHQIVACIRLICERMGFIQPVCVSEAIIELHRACQSIGGNDDLAMGFEVDIEEQSGYTTISSIQLQQQRESAIDVEKALDNLKKVTQSSIVMYCQLHCTLYEPIWISEPTVNTDSEDIDMRLRVNVCGLHRIPINEFSNYNTFKVEVCVYHGGRRISKRVLTPPAKVTKNFFPTITWSKWMKTDLTLYKIPREARICFTLYGLNPPMNPKEYLHTKEPLAWVAKQLFTTKGVLLSGPCLLGMWRDDSPADPTDTPYPNMEDRNSLILDVCFDDFNYQFGASRLSPCTPNGVPSVLSPTRPTPPQAIAKNMQDFASKDRFERLSEEDLRLIWSHRNSLPTLLSPFARGLPILSQSVPTSYPEDVKKFHNVLSLWPVCEPSHGLELLDSQYCDIKVRLKATEMISQFSEDDFIHLLPQILQSLKHDCFIDSPMHELLLKQAIASPRTAHYLYWNLVPLTSEPRFGWQYQLLLSAVLAACGEELSMELAQQSDLIKSLAEIAALVKNARDVQRQTCLVQAMKELSFSLPPVFRLPLNPAFQCCDVDLEGCSFFNSKTVPLKLSFKNADPFGKNIEVIFKAGDDLRQDMLALQLIQLMDKIWLRAGLDLRLISYQVLATGGDQGFVELVTESATLRQIQTQHGVTGSFKDKPLSEWLMRYNSSDSAWKRATENFTHSCAGYCVATYVLGICDRHNDNIMVKRSGHMFHIDFGKILGNAQMFGSIKRDRAPFILTPDMAYVINTGDKPSVRFQKFTDLCCTAYNELRKYSHLFLSLLSLLLSSNLPELSSVDDIQFVRDALLPSATEEEATFHFTKHIEASLSSLSTQINFFIHNLAQYKFSSHASSQGLLSFSPTSYSMFTDGKIASAVVVAYHLRFYPERHIVYQIQVHRYDNSKQDCILFRRYSEFDELHNKLLLSFPEDHLPHLPGKTYLPGRSYTKETSERRRDILNNYLSKLLQMNQEISESDVVYTFLHCLLRDEQDLRKMREEEQQAIAETRVAGKVKLDLRYNSTNKKFTIMVQHVQSLIPREGTDSTDPYVKLYLIPDPNKQTKLKTKIARKTLNPTYNEMLHYNNITPDELQSKSLQLTVWDASSILSKECLGVVIIELEPLYKELVRGHVDWFELQSTSL